MTSAIIDQVSVDIQNDENIILFRANGSSIKFKGMLAVYIDAKDDDIENGQEKYLGFKLRFVGRSRVKSQWNWTLGYSHQPQHGGKSKRYGC